MSRVLDELKTLWAACESGALSDEEAPDRLEALKERSRTIGQPLATTRVRRKLLVACYHDTEKMEALPGFVWVDCVSDSLCSRRVKALRASSAALRPCG